MALTRLMLCTALLICACSAFVVTTGHNRPRNAVQWMSTTDDASSPKQIPKPNVITPTTGSPNNKDKFLMMYTCKLCQGRNANMISKVAYNFGMVVATCRHCKQKHLIADNQVIVPRYPHYYSLTYVLLIHRVNWIWESTGRRSKST